MIRKILDYTGKDDIAAKKEFLETSEYTKDLTAVKEGRIYSASRSDMQGSAGSAATVEQIAQQLYPICLNKRMLAEKRSTAGGRRHFAVLQAFYIRDDRCFYLYFCDYGGSRN